VRSFYKNGLQKHEGKITVKNFNAISNKVPLYFGSIQKYNPDIHFDAYNVYKGNNRDASEEARIRLEMKRRGIKSK